MEKLKFYCVNKVEHEYICVRTDFILSKLYLRTTTGLDDTTEF